MSPENEIQPAPPERPTIESLPNALGYEETEELFRVGAQLVDAMRAGADTKELAICYLELAEVVADQTETDVPESSRLGLSIRLALLRRDGGVDAYRSDLEDAYVHAMQMGLDDVVELLQGELEQDKP